MKPPNDPSFAKDRRPGRTTAYQLWTWSAILASILVCVLVAWLHFEQQQTLRQMTAAIRIIRQARIELSKGFLYATLADDPNSPFNRDEGLALLQQAADTLLETAATASGDSAPPVSIAAFQQSLSAFQARLLEFRAAAAHQPRLETDLRIAFHDLENQARAIDMQSQEKLQALQSKLDFEFGLALAAAAVLLLGICGVMIYTGRAKEKSDIAQQERELELRESKQKYTLLFEKSAIPVILVKLPEVVIADANEAAEKLTGFKREELFGRNAAELGLISHTQRKETIEQFEKERASDENEMRIITKTGEERIVIANTNPLEIGGRAFAITTMQDITGRRQAEQELQVALTKYRTLFENFPLGISVADSAGSILETNPIAEALLGISEDEHKQRQIDGAKWRIIRPDGTSMPADEYASVRALEEGRKVENVEMGILKPDGSITWINVTAAPLSLEGYGVVVTYGDITERKQAEVQLQASEAKFKAVFENAPVGISLLDAKRNLLESNEVLEQIVHINKARLAAGAYRNRKYIREDGTEIPTSELASTRAIVEQRAIRDVVNGIVLEDGEIIWTQVSAAPLELPDPRFVVITQDITERKRAVDELRRSNAELEQFAYVASHDLQEPLRTVSGMVGLLQKRYQGQLDEQADEYIHFAVDASDRMQKLINGLLDFSRLDRQGQPFTTTEIERVLKTVLDNLQTAIAESRAQITSDPLPVVQADAGQLIQVFQNLIGNAIKFRSQRPLEIHIGAEKTGQGWQFAVQDNGIGIDPQYFERVFLLFQRLHTRRKHPGTGIGLALCKKIVERHGGKMWIQSAVNQGATFFFTLPERQK